jgi:hypothetical protein
MDYRPPAKPMAPKSMEFEVDASYFNTTSLLEADGTETALNSGDSFTVTEATTKVRYGLNKSILVGVGLKYRQIASSIGGTDETTSATNSGVESYGGELRYSLRSNRRLYYALFFQVWQSNYTNTSLNAGDAVPTDEVVLGDGGSQYMFGASVSFMRSKTHDLSLEGGYRRPGNDLSAEIPYHLRSLWLLGRLGFGIGAEGVYSIKSDRYGGVASDRPTQATGPSHLYNSTNRAYIAPRADIFVGFKKWRLGLYLSQVMQGQSTDKGMKAGINILINSKKGKNPQAKKVGSFKEYRIEATVVKVSPRGKFFRIDQGFTSDVAKGMFFDIYQADFFGKNVLVATGRVHSIKSASAILRVVKKHSKLKVKKGFVARAR